MLITCERATQSSRGRSFCLNMGCRSTRSILRPDNVSQDNQGALNLTCFSRCLLSLNLKIKARKKEICNVCNITKSNASQSGWQFQVMHSGLQFDFAIPHEEQKLKVMRNLAVCQHIHIFPPINETRSRTSFQLRPITGRQPLNGSWRNFCIICRTENQNRVRAPSASTTAALILT